MNGVEHYREAEKLLSLAVDDLSADAPDLAGEKVARAQVHATLALAAATALANHVEMSNTDANAWTVAASASTSYRNTAADMLARDPSAPGHRDPAEVADVIAMRAEMARAAGDDGSDVTS